MSKSQLFIIIQTSYGSYYALPTSLSGMSIMQAIPHLRRVVQSYRNGDYVYTLDEDTPNPIEISFAPVEIPEAEKPTDALPSGEDNPLEPGDAPGSADKLNNNILG